MITTFKIWCEECGEQYKVAQGETIQCSCGKRITTKAEIDPLKDLAEALKRVITSTRGSQGRFVIPSCESDWVTLASMLVLELSATVALVPHSEHSAMNHKYNQIVRERDNALAKIRIIEGYRSSWKEFSDEEEENG